MKQAARVFLGSGVLALAVLVTPCLLLRAEDSRPETTRDANVQRAIDRVYPALVQIHVLSLSHESGHERKQEAAGSGAIISPDGYVVTNHHVAGKATVIRVILSSREELDAKLVGTDALADIAVLKLDLSGRAAGAGALPVAKFGRSELLRVGDPVLAMGCPLALSHSVTRGIVANKDMMMPRFVRSSQFSIDGEDVGSIVKWIGHDASIQPGNSGGPLVNLEGEIVGVNEIGVGTMAGAIPSEIASPVAQELIEHGKVRRSFFGLDFQPLLKTDARGEGALVSGVVPGSPAEAAGAKAGDVLVSVDGASVRARFREELPPLNLLLLSKPVGQPVKLKLLRGAQEVSLAVSSELRDDAEGREVEVKAWGLTARELTTMVQKELERGDKRGVVVGSVRPGGPCDQAQPPIVPGDVIVLVSGKQVDGLDPFVALTAALLEGKTDRASVVATFERGPQRLVTLVEIGTKKPQDPTPEARKPWLAVETQAVSKKLASALGLKGKRGVRVSEVYPETRAAEAGLKTGDIVTQLDGTPIEAAEGHESEAFRETIRGYKVGATCELTVLRGEETVKVPVVLDEAPRPERELAEHDDPVLELRTRNLSFHDRMRHRWKKDEKGALVTAVESGGWASFGGLKQGDLIQSVDGKPVTGVEDLVPLLDSLREKRPKAVAFLVKRGIHTHFVEIEPVWPDAAKSGK